MLLDQLRAALGIATRHRCRRTDENLDRTVGHDAKEPKAKPPGEITESRVVLPTLASGRNASRQPNLIAQGGTVDALENKLKIEGKLELPNDDDRRTAILYGKDITAANFTFDGKAEPLEKAFYGKVKQRLQGLSSQ
jgi:hypothetical protein